MRVLEIEGVLFDQLVEEGALELTPDGKMVIRLDKVKVVKVHRTISAILNDSFEGRVRNPVLDMEVTKFFTRDRMKTHGSPHVVTRALNGLIDLRRKEDIKTMRDFMSKITSSRLWHMYPTGARTRKVILDTLGDAELVLPD